MLRLRRFGLTLLAFPLLAAGLAADDLPVIRPAVKSPAPAKAVEKSPAPAKAAETKAETGEERWQIVMLGNERERRGGPWPAQPARFRQPLLLAAAP